MVEMVASPQSMRRSQLGQKLPQVPTPIKKVVLTLSSTNNPGLINMTDSGVAYDKYQVEQP
jgi:hypothetical protein